MIVCYANPHKARSVDMCGRFACGVRACGERAVVVTDGLFRSSGQAAVFYGVQRWLLPVWHAVRSSGMPYLYIDNGYFRSRWHGGSYYRITANRLQHAGAGSSDGARLRQLGIRIAPWRGTGTRALIAMQSPWWYEWHGTTAQRWLARATRAAGDPVIVRHKEQGPPIDWTDVRCVVAHSSNLALDGLVEGVPCLVDADFAAARSLGAAFGEPLRYPDNRLAVFRVLADNQWSLDEIESGAAWQALTRSRATP